MPRDADGEFELVLGNKQLLSMFFLVVVLFAVFFSLGYMVGKSVSPAPTLAAQPSAGKTPSGAAPPDTVPTREAAPAPPAEPPAPAPTETQPARGEPVPAVATSPAAPLARELHLQIAAVRVKEDAEALADSLRKKGYTVVLNASAADGWYRVLVGPFTSDKAAQEMKVLLEKDGYKPLLRRP